jgi:hypothetical protein
MSRSGSKPPVKNPPPPSGRKAAEGAGKLTALERKVIRDLGQIWNDLCKVVGVDVTREPDLAELVVHIHALQHAVMANAAARRYPDEFRQLGEVIR